MELPERPNAAEAIVGKYLDMKVMGPTQVTTLRALGPGPLPSSSVAVAPRPPAARPAPSVAETKPPSAGGLR